MRFSLIFCAAVHLSAGEAVTVFAAASTSDVLSVIGKDYEAAHPGSKITFSFASSPTLAKQIEQGAPADLFITADLKWMDYAQEKRLIDPASRESLLGNRLVIVTPKGRAFPVTVSKAFDFPGAFKPGAPGPWTAGVEAGSDTASAFRGRLAVADPKGVPAGTYAKEAFTKLGWWSALESRLVPTADVRAALRLVELGEVDAGVVYVTDAAVTAKVEIVATIPEDLHQPIRYPVARTLTAKPEASAFQAHLRSGSATAVFTKAGFVVLAAGAAPAAPATATPAAAAK